MPGAALVVQEFHFKQRQRRLDPANRGAAGGSNLQPHGSCVLPRGHVVECLKVGCHNQRRPLSLQHAAPAPSGRPRTKVWLQQAYPILEDPSLSEHRVGQRLADIGNICIKARVGC